MREMIQILLFLLKLGFPLQSRNETEVVDEEREPEIRITPRFTIVRNIYPREMHTCLIDSSRMRRDV
jgi:hypothetical protein